MPDFQQFLTAYAKAWAKNDPQAIEFYWDLDDPIPFYKAEEVDSFFNTWSDLRAYWQHNATVHDAIRLKFGAPKHKRLADTLHLLAVPMRWDIAFAPEARTLNGRSFPYAGTMMGGDNFVVCVLRQTPAGLKLISWSETPNAPISYIRDLYHLNVSTDFPPKR